MGLYSRACDRFCWWAISRIAPGLTNSHYEYARRVQTSLFARTGRWLDIGCGHEFLPWWVQRRAAHFDLTGWNVFGIDMDHESLSRHTQLRGRALANGELLPFKDDSFDLITASMVVEHVANPHELFQEIGRVLTPGGKAIIHTPNIDGYTTAMARLIPDRLVAPIASALLGRKAEDIYPTHYRANSGSDIQRAIDGTQLSLDSLDFVESSPQTVRVPPLLLGELALIRRFRRPSLAQRRACLLATFSKRLA